MTRFAALAMYGFDEIKPHWEAIYEEAARQVAGAPPKLSWDHEVYETWTDPDLALGQTCGWPLMTRLFDSVRVVGTFAHVAGETEQGEYRSVLVARHQRLVRSFAGGRAAVNGFDSLSGWISLRAAIGADASWSQVVETGSHRASLQAVVSEQADIASIDAVTWWHAQRLWPRETSSLHVVARGPLVPCLPIITSARTSEPELMLWREGLIDALTRRNASAAALGITRFVPLDGDDYRRLLEPLQVFAEP